MVVLDAFSTGKRYGAYALTRPLDRPAPHPQVGDFDFSGSRSGRPAARRSLNSPTVPSHLFGEELEPEGAGSHLLIPEEVRAHRRFRPMVIMFIGRRGAGKSLAMTTLAYIQSRRYAAAGVAFSVVSNYKLQFATHATPYLIEELTQFPPWARDLYVCIDEVATAFPSRRSLAGVNLLFANWLTQIRKRRCEVAFTTQFPQVLDYQVLLQVDLFIRCQERAAGRAVELYIYDWWGQWTGNDSRRPWPPEHDTWDWNVTFLNTHTVWPLYDTEELVAPLWSSSREDVIAQEGWEIQALKEDEGGETEEAVVQEWVPHSAGTEPALSSPKGQAGPQENGHLRRVPISEPYSPHGPGDRVVGAGSGGPGGSLEELVADYWARQGKFDAAMLLSQAMDRNESIKDLKDFAVWLEANGYRVGRRRSKVYVDREPA